MEKRAYRYEGTVHEFDRLIAEHWEGTTYAVSPEKARSNLTYQFKKQFGRTANSKITLPGKLKDMGVV